METVNHKYSSPSARDEILPKKFGFGQRVRLLKEIRNDGTFPFAKIGDILMKAGSERVCQRYGRLLAGHPRYCRVEFIEEGKVYGCREEELENADDDYESDVEEELRWIREHRAAKAQS